MYNQIVKIYISVYFNVAEYAGMMDDFAGDNMDITLDKNILMGKKNDMEIEGGEVVDILEALGSTFPGDDFLNSFIDLSNFADIQVKHDYTFFLLLFRWGLISNLLLTITCYFIAQLIDNSCFFFPPFRKLKANQISHLLSQ